MVENQPDTSPTTYGGRTANVPDLKTLKSPEEGGTKKNYEDFLEKIQNHVSITWPFGDDIAYVLDNNARPKIPEPKDLPDDEQKIAWKKRIWNQKVDRYGLRIEALDDNLGAMYALVKEAMSKIMKAKVRSKTGYAHADTTRDLVWLLKAVEDIVLNFEETKPTILAVDDQMERIMSIKQGSSTNEDYIKTMTKEIKVYEKHGGNFLWGTHQDLQHKEVLAKAIIAHKQENQADMTAAEKEEASTRIKALLKQEIVSMALIKRADHTQFSNLQKELKNSYLLGQHRYPDTIPDVLKILNNYEATSSPTEQPTPPSRNEGRASFLQTGGGHTVRYLRGTNNSFF